MKVSIPTQWSGRTAVVVGGTDGIGKGLAILLGKAGLNVVIVGRDPDKGRRVVEELNLRGALADVQLRCADLSLMSEAHRLADELLRDFPKIDFLVQSAGIVRGKWTLTSEEIESNFAVNYLSRYVLTHRLLPALRGAAVDGFQSRILIVIGSANGVIHYDDVNLTGKFGMIRAVKQWCMANDLLARDIAMKLQRESEGRTSITTLKIGPVKTNIRSEFPLWMKLMTRFILDPIVSQTVDEVAIRAADLLLNQKYAAGNGDFYIKIRDFKKLDPTTSVLSADETDRLHELSERLVTIATGRAVSPALT